jgi:PTS system cellobiose-specific IIB component
LKEIRILLICGSGASSGFLAANIRKAAKNRGLDVVVSARSEAEIENYVNDIDCLLVGPHLAYLLEDVKRIIQDRPVKVALIDKENYARLDGEKALDQVLTLFE